MDIDGLGKLLPHPDVEGWLASTPVEVPFLDGLPMRFVFDGIEDDARPQDFVRASKNFLALTAVDRLGASDYVYRNYRDFVTAVGSQNVPCDIPGAGDVWASVHPTEIFVSRRAWRDRKVYVQITAECDWEEEHGLQVVYREGNVLSRVSSQDGHLTYTDAYNLPEDQDRICG